MFARLEHLHVSLSSFKPGSLPRYGKASHGILVLPVRLFQFVLHRARSKEILSDLHKSVFSVPKVGLEGFFC